MKLKKNDLVERLYPFTLAMFQHQRGTRMLENWHQREVTRALERCVTGRPKRLIINIPPRSGKTLMASQSFVAWAMGVFPDSHFILTSYSARLAAANTYAVRAMMQQPLYGELFPEVALMDDSKAKDEFRTRQGGVVYGTGTGGTITGYGAGKIGKGFGGAIIVDDAAKPDEAESDTVRRNVIDWFSQTLESRKNSQDTPIIVIGQRLHEQDLPGWLLSGGNGEEWELLKIPAQQDDGASFWPRQFPVDMLETMAEAKPYVFAGQYQQEPAPKGGGDFKASMIEIVDALPSDLRFTRGWDFAGTTKKRSDYTATCKLAIKEGTLWIAHAAHFKAGPEDVSRMVRQFADTDERTFTSLPQDPGQAGVAQKVSLSKLLQGRQFEFTPESGDKVTRAQPVASQVNVGNVKMLRGDWNAELLHELAVFPRGAHDDQVDALSRAYNEAIGGSTYTLDFL